MELYRTNTTVKDDSRDEIYILPSKFVSRLFLLCLMSWPMNLLYERSYLGICSELFFFFFSEKLESPH